MELLFITSVFMLFTLLQVVLGFGAALFSLLVLSFFIDIKELIIFALLINLVTNTLMLHLDWRHFQFKKWLSMLAYSLPFSIVGVYLIDVIPSDILVKIFAVFLLFVAIYSFKETQTSPLQRNFLLTISGFTQGLFSIGGPFTVAAVKNDFANKSEFRMVITAYFFTLNVIRFIQLFFIQKSFGFDRVTALWWLPIPIILVIWLGNKIHARISERHFKKSISILLLISALALLFKFS